MPTSSINIRTIVLVPLLFSVFFGSGFICASDANNSNSKPIEEIQFEVEEVEEAVVVRKKIRRRIGLCFLKTTPPYLNTLSVRHSSLPVQGHRLGNGLHAPLLI